MTLNGEEEKKERTLKEITKKKAEMSMLTTSLFAPAGKNPYYLNRGSRATAIRNMAELRDHLGVFTMEEIPWLASWIEYLGDKETADRLRETPEKFKEIIEKRYYALREFYN